MRSSSAHLLKDHIFLQGWSWTTGGLGELHGPVFMANTHELVNIGEIILSSLEESKEGLPHPVRWVRKNPKEDALLQATRMRSWNALMKASKRVTIDERDDCIKFQPLKFGGTTGENRGYHDLPHKALYSDRDPENLGRTLLEAFDLCE